MKQVFVFLALVLAALSAPSVEEVRSHINSLKSGSHALRNQAIPPEDTGAMHGLATSIAIALFPYYRAESTKSEIITATPSEYTPFAPLNEIGSQRTLSDETVTWLPSPSRDVMYQSIWTFLGHGHVYAFHYGPGNTGQYLGWELKKGHNLYPFQLLDPSNHAVTSSHDFVILSEWTNNWLDAHLKDWEEYVPSGYEIIVVDSTWLWLYGRIEMKPTITLAEVHAIQNLTEWKPIEDEFDSSNPILGVLSRLTKEEPVEYTVPTNIDPELGYFYALGEYLKANPTMPDTDWIWQYAPGIGLTKNGFDVSSFTTAQINAIKTAINDAMAVILDNVLMWGYHETTWIAITAESQIYQDWENKVLDTLDWATYCMVAKAALSPSGAIYALSWAYLENWAFGGMLNGSLDYQIIFTGGLPPVDAFWSITVYDNNQMLVSAPYMLGSDSDIVIDNPLVLCLGPTWNSNLCAESNYIPTPAGEGFMLELRMYLAQASVVSHTYTLPYIVHPV